MRILHVAEAFGGGILEMTVTTAEGAARQGHEVLIAHGVRPETPSDLRERIDPAVELRRLGWTRRSPAAQIRAARELRALVRDWRPDVVHLHSSFAGAVGAAVLRGGPPSVLTPNAFASALPESGPLRRAAYRAIERYICRRVTMVGAVSHSEVELARGFGARRVLRIPNGIPELDAGRTWTRAQDSGGRPSVIAIGRVIPQRRPEATARILAALRDIADVAWVGGGGDSRGEPGRRALEQAGLKPTGWLPREQVLERLADATVYLHWTAWDGLPLSVLEAVARDVVVVASDIAPNREILGAEGVCAGEPEAIERVRRIVADPDFAELQRRRQRERRGEFSAEAMVESWLAAYEQLAAAGAERRSTAVPA